MSRNVKLVGHWDDNDPTNAGWYIEVIDDATGDVVDDSMKVWFGVDVDSFGRHDADALRRALECEYPGAVSVEIR